MFNIFRLRLNINYVIFKTNLLVLHFISIYKDTYHKSNYISKETIFAIFFIRHFFRETLICV